MSTPNVIDNIFDYWGKCLKTQIAINVIYYEFWFLNVKFLCIKMFNDNVITIGILNWFTLFYLFLLLF